MCRRAAVTESTGRVRHRPRLLWADSGPGLLAEGETHIAGPAAGNFNPFPAVRGQGGGRNVSQSRKQLGQVGASQRSRVGFAETDPRLPGAGAGALRPRCGPGTLPAGKASRIHHGPGHAGSSRRPRAGRRTADNLAASPRRSRCACGHPLLALGEPRSAPVSVRPVHRVTTRTGAIWRPHGEPSYSPHSRRLTPSPN
jgi:hypothetical protein